MYFWQWKYLQCSVLWSLFLVQKRNLSPFLIYNPFTLKVSKYQKQIMKSQTLPKKNERNSLGYYPKCVSFVFWKNQRHHNLLSRFSDLYQSLVYYWSWKIYSFCKIVLSWKQLRSRKSSSVSWIPRLIRWRIEYVRTEYILI